MLLAAASRHIPGYSVYDTSLYVTSLRALKGSTVPCFESGLQRAWTSQWWAKRYVNVTIVEWYTATSALLVWGRGALHCRAAASLSGIGPLEIIVMLLFDRSFRSLAETKKPVYLVLLVHLFRT